MRRASILARRSPRGEERGQGLVEFALVVPLFLLLLFSMLDFGFAFYTKLTIEYATREGARVGAALANGNTTAPCADVDSHVIAAVQRVLQSAGITVRLDPSDATQSGVNWIRIYKATGKVDGSGWDTGGTYNQWTYTSSGGPTVDGTALSFKGPATPAWNACSRSNLPSAPDKLGVAINYRYAWQTPIVNVIGIVSGGTFLANVTYTDTTVMDLNPTYP